MHRTDVASADDDGLSSQVLGGKIQGGKLVLEKVSGCERHRIYRVFVTGVRVRERKIGREKKGEKKEEKERRSGVAVETMISSPFIASLILLGLRVTTRPIAITQI